MADALLKFQVPDHQRAAVRRALVTAAAPARRLRLFVADTTSGDLAQAGLTLRLQQQGRQWTQVLATRATGFSPPSEHVVPVPALGKHLPVVELQRHAGAALAGGQPSHHLLSIFSAQHGHRSATRLLGEVQLERVQRVLRSGSTRVQVTFDRGELRVGDSRWPLCELTFERLAGPEAGLVACAARWMERHGLWFNPEGWMTLAQGLAQASAQALTQGLADSAVQPEGRRAATKAGAPPLTARLTPSQALRAMVGHGLQQLFPHAARLAAGTGGPQQLHQARVALRRLRTVLRVFGSWSEDAPDPAWSATLDDVFRRLGAARDTDALSAGLLPELRAAGAPMVDLPLGAQAEPPMQVLRSTACNRMLLELLAFSVQAPAEGSAAQAAVDGARAGHPPEAAVALPDLAAPLLGRMHRRIAKDAKAFLGVDDAARHQTRKRLKRLRYSAEFVAPLFPPKVVADYLKPLRKAQEALGSFNDLTVADQFFRSLVEHEPRAWFAIGWLAARRQASLHECATALAAMAGARRFWKAG